MPDVLQHRDLTEEEAERFAKAQREETPEAKISVNPQGNGLWTLRVELPDNPEATSLAPVIGGVVAAAAVSGIASSIVKAGGATTAQAAAAGTAAGAAAGIAAGAAVNALAEEPTGPEAVPGSRGSEFAGAALTLSDDDLKQAAEQLGCELAALRSVDEVESAGKGFLKSNRPKILFEAHVFSKQTGHRYDNTHPEISSPKWNRRLYKGGEAEYDRLEQAVALDRSSALKSASWGRYQILGLNHASAGFADVEAFVAAMVQSEGEHLRALAMFLKSNPAMLTALRNRDWKEFARLYNGPRYKDNKYDVKLETAYARCSR
jgi:hypothetical protein